MAALDLGPRSWKRIYWGCIRVGWWWSLLATTQAVPQRQPRSLAVGDSPIVVRYPAMNDERPHRHPSLTHTVIPQQGGGLWKLQAVIGCEEQRGLEPKAVTEHNHRGPHRHCTGPLSMANTPLIAENSHRPHVLQQQPPNLGQRFQCGERGKSHI